MQLAEVNALCDQLREVIAAGPGKNELALQEAMGIVSVPDGGFGLIIVRAVASSMQYERAADHNRLTVTLPAL